MVDHNSPERLEELNRALELLHFGYRAFVREADQLLAHQGLGRVHHRILYFVGREPGVDLAQLRQTLAISKQALHGPLRQLQREQLVLSDPHPRDKRSRCLRLSTHGRQLEQEVSQAQHRLLERVFDGDPEAERHWRRLMGRLAQRETDRPLG